jgi:hypothetical protein
MPQEEFKLVDILQESKKYKGINHAKDSTVLEERISNLLESL